jgi:hypothetical protein
MSLGIVTLKPKPTVFAKKEEELRIETVKSEADSPERPEVKPTLNSPKLKSYEKPSTQEKTTTHQKTKTHEPKLVLSDPTSDVEANPVKLDKTVDDLTSSDYIKLAPEGKEESDAS